jgi:hypothetical protein
MGADSRPLVIDYVRPNGIDEAKAMVLTLGARLAAGEVSIELHNALLHGIEVYLRDRSQEQERILESLELQQQGLELPWQGNSHELPS